MTDPNELKWIRRLLRVGAVLFFIRLVMEALLLLNVIGFPWWYIYF